MSAWQCKFVKPSSHAIVNVYKHICIIRYHSRMNSLVQRVSGGSFLKTGRQTMVLPLRVLLAEMTMQFSHRCVYMQSHKLLSIYKYLYTTYIHIHIYIYLAKTI